MGIQALCPQPGTSKRHPHHKVYPYLAPLDVHKLR